MDHDAHRRQLHRLDYVARTKPQWREKAFLYPAAAMLKGGLWIAGCALCAMMFGVASAAFVLAAGLFSVAASFPLLHIGSSLHDRRAEEAMKRDLDSGMLSLSPPQPRHDLMLVTPAPVRALGDRNLQQVFATPTPDKPAAMRPVPASALHSLAA